MLKLILILCCTISVVLSEQKDCKSNVERNSPKCNGHGDFYCKHNICVCHEHYLGDECQCFLLAPITYDEMQSNCKRTNDNECGGRGACNCGQCQCYQRSNPTERVSGRFCECDNFNCPRHNRRICGGHGECVCQECQCQEGWQGRACQCPTSHEPCMASNGKICNGRGECICGKCRCFDDAESIRYSGPHCDICPTCPLKCSILKSCVMCQQFHTGPYNSGQKCEDECQFFSISVDQLPENKTTCQFVDPYDDCTFYFVYEDNDDQTTVWVKNTKDCPPPVEIVAVILKECPPPKLMMTINTTEPGCSLPEIQWINTTDGYPQTKLVWNLPISKRLECPFPNLSWLEETEGCPLPNLIWVFRDGYPQINLDWSHTKEVYGSKPKFNWSNVTTAAVEPVCESLLNPGHAQNPCNGGTCFPVTNEMNEDESVCLCPPGFSGELCQMPQCTPNPCLNNGNCSTVHGMNGFLCKCTTGFLGSRCQYKLKPF